MIRTITLGLVSLVLIASPSSSNAGVILDGPSFHNAYAEDGSIFDNADDFPASFPAANSLSASITDASGTQAYSYTRSGMVTEFQTTSTGAVSGLPSSHRYGDGFFVISFTMTTNATYSYSMSVSTTGTADDLSASVQLLDLNTFLDKINVSSSGTGTGTLTSGHSYVLFGLAAAENFSFEGGGLGETGFISADFNLQITSDVPEPSSVALLGLGLVGMAGYGWRRRKIGATA